MDIKVHDDTAMPVSKDSTLKIAAWLDKDNPELERAYNELPGGPFAFHSAASEQWYYQGTGRTEEGVYIHAFRHRCHPFTNQRMYRAVKAMPTWFPAPKEVRGTR